MKIKRLGQIGLGIVLIAAMGLPLAGCSSAGSSAFGSNKVEIAELAAGAATTPEMALMKGRSHFRNNDFGHSAAYYKKAVEMAPNNTEGYFGLAASYDRLGRFDLADRAYAALAKLGGPSLQYHNNLGYSYMLRGDLKKAFDSFYRAKQIDPDNIVVANNLQLLSDAARNDRV